MFFCPYSMRGTFITSRQNLNNSIKATRNVRVRGQSDRYAMTFSARGERLLPMPQTGRTSLLVEAHAPHNDTSVQSQSEREKTVADNEDGSSIGGVVKRQCGQVYAHSGSFHIQESRYAILDPDSLSLHMSANTDKLDLQDTARYRSIPKERSVL